MKKKAKDTRNKTKKASASSRNQTIADLKNEIEKLHDIMAHMEFNAAANELIWRQFADVERILFRTRDLGNLVEELLKEIMLRFEIQQVVLFLCHSDLRESFFPEISREGLVIAEGNWIIPLAGDQCTPFHGEDARPILLQQEDMNELLSILPEAASSVRSGVLIPLTFHQILFGGLFLGSHDPARYRHGDATDLLEHLGIKIALCMDNCLAYERAKNFGTTDSVTGLLNYFEIHSILNREFRRTRRSKLPLSVLAIDLNFVHEYGPCSMADEVLTHSANILRETLPKNETYLARYGSSEFVAVLPEVPENEVREVIPYLTQMIRKSPFKHQNTVILIQPIMGVGSRHEDMTSHQELLDMAHSNLHKKKLSQTQEQGYCKGQAQPGFSGCK